MLTVDHTHRITAKQALLHPFFDTVRQRILEETAAQYPDFARDPYEGFDDSELYFDGDTTEGDN